MLYLEPHLPLSEGTASFAALYAEIERLPQGVTGEILEPGVLRTMSRPGRAHARVIKQCLRALSKFDIEDGGSGWWILAEHEIRFPGQRLVVPDIAGWSAERTPKLPDENPLRVLPDWCCEVLSPSTARDDRLLKLPIYASSGVSWVWLVDPVLHSIEVYRTVEGLATLVETAHDDAEVTLSPFTGDIALARWWMPEQP